MTVVSEARFLDRTGLDDLIRGLESDGRRVIGPTARDGVIAYDEIHSAAELPVGLRDEQAAGRYALVEGDPQRTFGFNAGPSGWKPFTFPSRAPVGTSVLEDGRVAFEPAPPAAEPTAFLGMRACELAALRIHDRVLRDGAVADPDYAARRADNLIVAVECTTAASTCFCTSMGTGPEVPTSDSDLTLTEVDGGFVVRTGSEAGRDILSRVRTRPATEAEVGAGRAAVAGVREAIGDPVHVDGLGGRLRARLDHPRWADVAERCLACANCTLVCPTCFCTSLTQQADLGGTAATTERTWDSCFSGDFAKVAGGTFRGRPQDRYRQWLTHKFSSWVDQFGTFGCVGCGRCIAWCPAAIDVREELAAIAGVSHRPPLPMAVAATPGSFVAATIAGTAPETGDTTTLVLDEEPAVASGGPGQFLMVTRPGFPAVPISISRYLPSESRVELSIRAAGAATAAFTGLGPGEQLGIRGPLGRGWSVDAAEGRDVVIVAGGIGLSPLRPLIDALLAERSRFGAVRLFYGARTPADRVHAVDLAAWAGGGDIEVESTVDRAGDGWTGPVGVVTHLFDAGDWDGRDAVAYVCGPERMMQATVATLQDRGIREERIHVSMERHMDCGVGLCGHCQMGRFFICRDGPVFTLAELGGAFWREGV